MKLSLNSLTDFADIRRSQFYDVLKGSRPATTDCLAKVATVLEVEPFKLRVARGPESPFEPCRLHR